jgi:hypothetical protein
MKTLDDVKLDMSTLYDEVNTGTTELKIAAELANIAGKFLKAEQLSLAREMFSSQLGRKVEGQAAAQLTHSA